MTSYESVATGRLGRAGLVAAVVAAIGNLIVFVLGNSVLGSPLMISARPGSTELIPLPVPAVIFASVVPAVVATGLLALLGRFVSRPIRVFEIIAVIFLLLSAVPILSLPAAVGVQTKVALGLMHIVAAVAIVSTLTRLGREK